MDNKPKTHSLRFTPAQWAAGQAEADRRGYSGPNAFFAAILDGDLPVGLEPAKLNTYADRILALELRIEGVDDELVALRRQVAGAPLLGATDLP
jgi:hypothetical protein